MKKWEMNIFQKLSFELTLFLIRVEYKHELTEEEYASILAGLLERKGFRMW